MDLSKPSTDRRKIFRQAAPDFFVGSPTPDIGTLRRALLQKLTSPGTKNPHSECWRVLNSYLARQAPQLSAEERLGIAANIGGMLRVNAPAECILAETDEDIRRALASKT